MGGGGHNRIENGCQISSVNLHDENIFLKKQKNGTTKYKTARVIFAFCLANILTC